MVPMDKLQAIVKRSGLKLEEQAAFYKVATGSCAIYIAKTQKVSRVDLSGFSIKHPACIRLSDKEAHDLKLGHVRGQLDFSKSEDRVLEAFQTALTEMKRLAKSGQKEDRKPAKKASPKNAATPQQHDGHAEPQAQA